MDTWHVDATTAGTFRTGDGFDGMWMRPLNRRQLRDVLVAMTVVFLAAGYASVDAAAGQTELELARAIHGEKARQQRVNQDCVMLVIEGRAERRGRGRGTEPYRYWPAVIGREQPWPST
jgi:hypothetical protein